MNEDDMIKCPECHVWRPRQPQQTLKKFEQKDIYTNKSNSTIKDDIILITAIILITLIIMIQL